MNIVLNIFLIQVLVCFVIDLSGFILELESFLAKWLKVRVSIPKPWSCSLCLGWWVNLAYLLFTGHLTLPLVVATAITAFLAKNISGFLRWVSEFLIKIETLLYKIIR